MPRGCDGCTEICAEIEHASHSALALALVSAMVVVAVVVAVLALQMLVKFREETSTATLVWSSQVRKLVPVAKGTKVTQQLRFESERQLARDQ